MLWADLAHKLADQVVTPLNTYQAQFPEMRVSNGFFKETKDVITSDMFDSELYPSFVLFGINKIFMLFLFFWFLSKSYLRISVAETS